MYYSDVKLLHDLLERIHLWRSLVWFEPESGLQVLDEHIAQTSGCDLVNVLIPGEETQRLYPRRDLKTQINRLENFDIALLQLLPILEQLTEKTW